MDQLLKSKYRTGQKLSENPFSVTYRGSLIGGEKPVVIKIYKRGTLNSSLIKSMKQRVRDFSLLSHHGIARLLDGDYGWQGFYFVREFIDGSSLEEMLSRDGKLGAEKAQAVAGEVLETLALTHAKGIVHGALKPSNIFIDRQGLVKLADFVVEGEIKSALPQRVIEVLENACYASPEELAGQPAGAASDLYALGLVLFELATGQPAVAGVGGNLAKLRGGLPDAAELGRLPNYLREIVVKALQRDPLLRFASAAEFRESLAHKTILRRRRGDQELVRIFESVVTQYGGEEITIEHEALQDVGRLRLRWGQEKHRNWILAAVLLVAVAVGVLYAFLMGR
ncbi:MAG: serine/threonine protein kinase [Candidatus Saganbacteria bacterium]|nr:serine/threonine protein kinase [Candidatus Saganbacteria bacterium]